ncbi:peptide chain release factor N(5)-glutamine methyltransferase [Xenorhabdus griffiniae]|uniref:Release factor glutamine methyltransferase n=1 Tax=Xenorhabdus griffiniae TaxID=351672 RepID=A0ABY9XD21_9GAMM|nr:peptide chain release factor N(5)-glutamine methyltransferase [Xenorhabdus griffiniae]MBD1228096.1 peptide chain release factor N(5)-glutamine methyltransferase [Xenorhabdus griffiniae]MBE8587256.1 peptide chain release factor N(5)-glutamine methyltransferase [Xenorhabdus griffiniae]WMV70788.1 peptide chain release factor N(5)-glutamine methyltransferase [Xenorhabdus griffiniae]WNH00464.1 peptide chain release factor N(5)-glutamine methyltransferase [Xenorhabdus griffiniae]
MNYQHWLRHAAMQLTESDSPKRDAEILLQHVTGRSRTYLIAFHETPISPKEVSQLETLLARRIQGEPIAYIVGEREFWSLSLTVSPATLIPRPDTECLVEKALELLPVSSAQILDLGTGTGAIALALASERHDCYVTGVDINPDAVALARHNAARNAEKLSVHNVNFLQSEWFSAVGERQFDMIVSNPPYIDELDPHLREGDVRFEPATALIAAQNGIADLQTIIEQARHFLLPNGWLLLEHGWKQGIVVRNLFLEKGYQQIATFQDYGGNERITVGQWNKDENHS